MSYSNDFSRFERMLNRHIVDKKGQHVIANSSRTSFRKATSQESYANEGALRYDQWKDIDSEVIKVAVDRLVGIADLRGAGLVHNTGGLGKTISQWEEESNMTGANIDMSGITRGEEDHLNYNLMSVPVPIVHKDFRLNIRNLEASRFGGGESLDTAQAGVAARVVAEASEDMLFAGRPIVVNGNTIYGYTTFPDRNQVDFGTNGTWDSPAKTGQNILDDVLNMIQASIDAKYFGAFKLYVPAAYETKLQSDFKSETSGTIEERILSLRQISGIEYADRLATGNVLLVQLTREVVDLAVGQDITTIQWQEQGGMVENFKVMACWAPRLKKDYDGRCGITHLLDLP